MIDGLNQVLEKLKEIRDAAQDEIDCGGRVVTMPSEFDELIEAIDAEILDQKEERG